jgi:hypothetical protein
VRVRFPAIAFLRGHRGDYETLLLLAGSPLMQLTLSLARESSQVGQRMRVYDERPAFEAELRRHAGLRPDA